MRTTQQNPLIWLLLLFSILACLIAPQQGNSSATGSYGQSNINGDYQSVSTQSGIQAGDGGFGE